MNPSTLSMFSAVLPDLRWLRIDPDGSHEVVEGQMTAQDLRDAIGRTPKQVRSPWDASVFVSTDPASPMPVNWLGTLVLRQSFGPGEQVRGPVVILGPVDEADEVTGVTDDLVAEVEKAITVYERSRQPA